MSATLTQAVSSVPVPTGARPPKENHHALRS